MNVEHANSISPPPEAPGAVLRVIVIPVPASKNTLSFVLSLPVNFIPGDNNASRLYVVLPSAAPPVSSSARIHLPPLTLALYFNILLVVGDEP